MQSSIYHKFFDKITELNFSFNIYIYYCLQKLKKYEKYNNNKIIKKEEKVFTFFSSSTNVQNDIVFPSMKQNPKMSKEMIEAMTSSGGTSVHEIRCGRSLNLTLDNVYDSQRSHLLSLIQERASANDSRSSNLSYSHLSFFARLSNRLFIVRYLRARNTQRKELYFLAMD